MKCIVADDSAFVRSILIKALESNFENPEILPCKNGKEALETLMTNDDIEWLITDLLMPEMTGQQLIQAINHEGIIVKTVIISADIQKGTREEIKSLGVSHYINKPLTQEKIGSLMSLLKGAAYAE